MPSLNKNIILATSTILMFLSCAQASVNQCPFNSGEIYALITKAQFKVEKILKTESGLALTGSAMVSPCLKESTLALDINQNAARGLLDHPTAGIVIAAKGEMKMEKFSLAITTDPIIAKKLMDQLQITGSLSPYISSKVRLRFFGVYGAPIEIKNILPLKELQQSMWCEVTVPTTMYCNNFPETSFRSLPACLRSDRFTGPQRLEVQNSLEIKDLYLTRPDLHVGIYSVHDNLCFRTEARTPWIIGAIQATLDRHPISVGDNFFLTQLSLIEVEVPIQW